MTQHVVVFENLKYAIKSSTVARLTSDHDANRVFCVSRHENAPRVDDYAVWRDSRKTRHQPRNRKTCEEAASPRRSGAPEGTTAAAAWLTRGTPLAYVIKALDRVSHTSSCFLFCSQSFLAINKSDTSTASKSVITNFRIFCIPFRTWTYRQKIQNLRL